MRSDSMYKRFCKRIDRIDPFKWYARFATVFTYTGRDWRKRFGWEVWFSYRLHGIINPLIHWFPECIWAERLNNKFASIWITATR